MAFCFILFFQDCTLNVAFQPKIYFVRRLHELLGYNIFPEQYVCPNSLLSKRKTRVVGYAGLVLRVSNSKNYPIGLWLLIGQIKGQVQLDVNSYIITKIKYNGKKHSLT